MDPALLNIVVCPLTHGKLRQEGDFLVSDEGIRYPIKDGLPVLLPDAAILPEGVTLEQIKAKVGGAGQ